MYQTWDIYENGMIFPAGGGQRGFLCFSLFRKILNNFDLR